MPDISKANSLLIRLKQCEDEYRRLASFPVLVQRGLSPKEQQAQVEYVRRQQSPKEYADVDRRKAELLGELASHATGAAEIGRVLDDPSLGNIESAIRALLASPLNIARDESPGQRQEATPAKANSAPGKGMTWQDAARVAEDHCARNPFPGVNALARIVGCSQATMSKAVDRSAKLRAKMVEHEAQRKSVSALAMTEAAVASAKQSREPDPIDAESASTDSLFRRILESAKPHERAKLNTMTAEQQRKLVATYAHDPDRNPRVRGRSR